MTAFVLAACALTLLAMGAVFLGPRRAPPSPDSRRRVNAQVAGQQLAELEEERRRGLLDEGDFERARDELRRRVLADTEETGAGSARGISLRRTRSPRRMLALYAAVLPLAAAALYVHFGNPQMLRSSGTDAVAAAGLAGAENANDFLARLRAHTAGAPGDARAWVLLARAHMQRDEFEPAARAYAAALAASPKVARDPMVWCEYADALGMAQGGRLAGRPRQMVEKALALDTAHPRALEMAGSAAYEAGEFADAQRYWQRLLARLPADSAEHAQLAAAIDRAQRRARMALAPG